jgi:hypothetical protein
MAGCRSPTLEARPIDRLASTTSNDRQTARNQPLRL